MSNYQSNFHKCYDALPMETFEDWLKAAMIERGLQQADVLRKAAQGGHKLSQGYLSQVYNGAKEPGGDAVIAIAYGLGVTLEEAFRARGWLKARSGLSTQLAEVADQLPEEDRRFLLKVAAALANQPAPIIETAVDDGPPRVDGMTAMEHYQAGTRGLEQPEPRQEAPHTQPEPPK